MNAPQLYISLAHCSEKGHQFPFGGAGSLLTFPWSPMSEVRNGVQMLELVPHHNFVGVCIRNRKDHSHTHIH